MLSVDADITDSARGLLLVALGYGVISCADAAVKWALPEIGAAAAMVWRGVVGAAVVAAIARGRGLWPVNWKLLLARSVLHTTVSGSWYVAWVRGVARAPSLLLASAAESLCLPRSVPMTSSSPSLGTGVRASPICPVPCRWRERGVMS